MFDLDKSLQSWLKAFRKHKAFGHGTIREMELHLRDHIDDLVSSGLNEQDAFGNCCQRVRRDQADGQRDLLESKTNNE